ncbi:MAG: outer membrane beta-barrel protein [Rickettsia endosymbiont of Bryobia graminum]|nr:outer membrane beta-barrel protein [Rickettsia endosymbiont of Bryobia graminum]
MKKLLLIAAATSTLLTSFSSFACHKCEEKVPVIAPCANIASEAGMFYGKVEAGVSFLNRAKDKFWDVRMKGKNTSGIFGAGVGYYMMDNLRTDLTLDFLTEAKFKKTFTNTTTGNAIHLKHKGDNIMSVMVNAYYDLYEFGIFRPFIGAGIGWGQVKEKINALDTVTGLADNYSTKKTNNFVYQLSVGGGFDITQDIRGELSYRWVDYGKTKHARNQVPVNGKLYGKTRYATHNIVLGARFAM